MGCLLTVLIKGLVVLVKMDNNNKVVVQIPKSTVATRVDYHVLFVAIILGKLLLVPLWLTCGGTRGG